MLGYTELDVSDMQIAIEEAIELLPPTASVALVDQLERAVDFLQGLIIEGHVGD